MKSAIDMVGKQCGRLHVMERVLTAETVSYKALWLCKCECGNELVASGDNLRRGNTQSCGCLQKERANKAKTTHGESHSPEYKAWQQAKIRCTNPKNVAYHNYGGRGIKMVKAWLDSFEAFYKHIGPKPDGVWGLDRINNNGNYAPGNVRWVSIRVSNGNRRAPRRRRRFT